MNGYFAPPTDQGLAFYPATPCRIADTREYERLAGGLTRTFQIAGTCNIPSTAQAYSLNLTAVPAGPLNYLVALPAGKAQTGVSTLNSDGRIVANAAIIAANANGAIDVFATDPTDLIIDVNGYFAPPGAPNALYFHPLAVPCRAVDTRGGQALAANSPRAFLIDPSCGVPSTAQAYSLNFTVVPSEPLDYLTTWAQGEAQPFVSTLNSPRGKVVANAAIVKAGTNGAIAVFVTNPTDLILDINGYFAP